jgi:hypothetical protein
VVPAVAAAVVFVVLANALWLLSLRFAARRKTVVAPTGEPFDVLVHRDGVMPYTKGDAFWNLLGPFPVIFGVVRRSRGRVGWTVRVRRSPFHGYPDLISEVVPDEPAARTRAEALAREIEAGERPWPAERES